MGSLLTEMTQHGDFTGPGLEATKKERALTYCGQGTLDSKVLEGGYDVALDLLTTPMKTVKFLYKGGAISKKLFEKLKKKAIKETGKKLKEEIKQEVHQSQSQVMNATNNTEDTECSCTITVVFNPKTEKFGGSIKGKVGEDVNKKGHTDCCNAKSFNIDIDGELVEAAGTWGVEL